MALTNSVTSYTPRPFDGNRANVTPDNWERLQTIGSSVTQGGVEIFADPAASDNFLLTNLELTFYAASGSSEVIAYLATTPLARFPTIPAGTIVHHSLNFGDAGLQGGTTTTATVSVFSTVATVTTEFVATGWRKR
jgi:hypothetical protein